MKEERLYKSMLEFPFHHEWCEYKNTVYVAQVNFEKSVESKRLMIDLAYCLTKSLNQVIEKTVAYNKNKFKATTKRN